MGCCIESEDTIYLYKNRKRSKYKELIYKKPVRYNFRNIPENNGSKIFSNNKSNKQNFSNVLKSSYVPSSERSKLRNSLNLIFPKENSSPNDIYNNNEEIPLEETNNNINDINIYDIHSNNEDSNFNINNNHNPQLNFSNISQKAKVKKIYPGNNPQIDNNYYLDNEENANDLNLYNFQNQYFNEDLNNNQLYHSYQIPKFQISNSYQNNDIINSYSYRTLPNNFLQNY